MYTIWAGDTELLFDMADPRDQKGILNISCSLEIGTAGSLEFMMLPSHYFYNSLEKLKTKISVWSNGKEIFTGRILNTTTDIYKQKNVHCEGDLAYLNDSVQPPVKKTTMTIATFFSACITAHNSQVEVGKRFTVGTVNIDDASTSHEFDIGSYRNTKSTIESDLISMYGGYLRTRTVGGTTYIDWLKDYGYTSTQNLVFSQNIIDLSEYIGADDIFTVLLPTGDTVEIENPAVKIPFVPKGPTTTPPLIPPEDLPNPDTPLPTWGDTWTGLKDWLMGLIEGPNTP